MTNKTKVKGFYFGRFKPFDTSGKAEKLLMKHGKFIKMANGAYRLECTPLGKGIKWIKT